MPPAIQVAAKDESGDAHKQASNYIQRTMALEGSGKDPNSSAVGGFLDGTWVNLVRKNVPEAASLPDAQVLAARDDPVLRARMVAAYAQENAAVLQKSGIEPDPNTLRLAHWFGAEGAKRVLTADPGTPIDRLFPLNVIASNPVLSGKTAGDVVDLVHKQMSTPTLKEWATGASTALKDHAQALEAEADRMADKYHTDASELMRQANQAPAGTKEREDAIAELRQRERHYTEEYERIAKSPPAMKPVDALANFGSAGTIIALIGGLFARNHMTAALSAAGAAMKAINENNHEQFEKTYKTWEHQSATALEMVRLHNDEIRNLIDDRRMAESEKNARLGVMFQALGMDRQADMMRLGAHEKVFTEQASLDRTLQAAGQYRLQFQIGAAANLEAKYIADGMDPIEAKRKAGVEAGLIPSGAAETPAKSQQQELTREITRRDDKFKADNPGATKDQIDEAHHKNDLASRSEMALATSRSPTGQLSDESVKLLAKQYEMGDMSVITSLPRGGPGRIQVENQIAADVKELPDAAAQIVMNRLRMAEAKSAAQTAGRVTMQTDMYATEARGAGAQVIETSKLFPRSNFPTVNAALAAFEQGTGDPNIVRFGAALNSFINVYGKLSNPTGIGIHDADKERITKIMDRSLSQGQIDAGVAQIITEGQIVANAAREAQVQVLAGIAPTVPSAHPSPAAPSTAVQPQSGRALPMIDNQAAYDALPSGTEFVTRDGKRGKKP